MFGQVGQLASLLDGIRQLSFGARPLDEAQIIGVIDDPRKVGILEIDAQREMMDGADEGAAEQDEGKRAAVAQAMDIGRRYVQSCQYGQTTSPDLAARFRLPAGDVAAGRCMTPSENRSNPLARPLTGEEVKTLLRTGSAPAGTDPSSAQAYANYIRRLQAGMSGFTCYASLQMPR